MIRVGVIGVGSFGAKRAAAVTQSSGGTLVGIADEDAERVQTVAKELETEPHGVEGLLTRNDVDVIVVCVPNKFHMPVTINALQNGKHVLCEKPLARTVEEGQQMVAASVKAGKLLKTGSNHRYFASVRKAYEVIQSGFIGDVIGFNGRIGNNGERVKNSWFWDREMSGGGTLLDNGCHLLDIARWFMGDFVEGRGLVSNAYWKDCPVEDSATGIFLTEDGRMAIINSSWRQLSGYFHFEINGTDGYITVDCRFDTHGGDRVYWRSVKERGEIYGTDYGRVKPDSYVLELDEFFDCIQKGLAPAPSGQDGLEVLKMVEDIYKSKAGPGGA